MLTLASDFVIKDEDTVSTMRPLIEPDLQRAIAKVNIQVTSVECEIRRCDDCPYQLYEAGPAPRFIFTCGCDCHHEYADVGEMPELDGQAGPLR